MADIVQRPSSGLTPRPPTSLRKARTETIRQAQTTAMQIEADAAVIQHAMSCALDVHETRYALAGNDPELLGVLGRLEGLWVLTAERRIRSSNSALGL